MLCYRIVQDPARAGDLSGTGAFLYGGRWNNKGTYMLYTAESSSLAFLESLVHFDEGLTPPALYVMSIEINRAQLIFTLPATAYQKNWIKEDNKRNQQQGDQWMLEKKYLGIRVRSAINRLENNVLLNPLFPGFRDLVRIVSVSRIPVDKRLK